VTTPAQSGTSGPRAPHAGIALACFAACLFAGAPVAADTPGPAATAKATAGATTRPVAVAPLESDSDLGQTPIRRGAGARPTTAPASGAATTRPAATTPAGVSYGFELPRVLMALGIVLGLIFLLRWVMKSFFAGGVAGAAAGSRAMQVLSRSPLSPRQQLLLVRVGRRLIVVGDSAGQMTALSEITDPDEVAALVGQLQDEKLSAASRTFGGLFTRVRKGFNGGSDPEDGVEDGDAITVVGADERTGPSFAAIRDERPKDEGDDDASVAGARGEIRDLMDKVRLVTHQFKQS
jgi:flagellar biosynthetic protein FliO